MFGFRASRQGGVAQADGPASSMEQDIALVQAWSPEERAERERKFVRRIDLRLLPILVSIMFSYFKRADR